MLIKLDSVSKAYDRTLFSNLSLSISEGDRICLFGESGCGKTTLLNIILGITKPDSGEVVRADGLKMSAVFQEDRLIEHLTGVENIYALSNKKGDISSATSALVAVGIGPAEFDKPVREWSGGMRRRAAVVRAMLSDSSLIAMDEPFNGLDAKTRRVVADFISVNIGSRALLLISHSQKDAERLSCSFVKLP